MTAFLETVLDKTFWWQLLIKTFKTSFCYYSFVIKKDKNFMVHFYGWGSTASRLEPLRGGSLLFTTKSQKFLILTYRPRKDERLSRPWSHPLVLNTGSLNWESSALTTRPLFHKIKRNTNSSLNQCIFSLKLSLIISV